MQNSKMIWLDFCEKYFEDQSDSQMFKHGEGNGNSLQYSCLGNPRDRGTWWATVYGVAKEWDMT